MKKYSLEIVVFLCGTCLMILEIVGSRVLAPYVGTSTIVWTTLIGVILGSLSIGYFIGGKLADRKSSSKTLSHIILVSAIFIYLLVILNSTILSFTVLNVKNLGLATTISTIILFSTPSVLLGIVSPYATRLKIKSITSSGMTIGSLYSISTIGSIVGTFAAGLFLIPFFGTIKILYLIIFVLIISSLILNFPKKVDKWLFFLIFFLAISFISFVNNYQIKKSTGIEIDTQYSRIQIFKGFDQSTRRPIKYLVTDPFGIQAAIFDDVDNSFVSRYLKYFRLGDYFNSNINTALMIGGGGYLYPKDFLAKHPNASIDVIEIDPQITEIAKKHFNLKDNSRLKIYSEDGRVFLNNNQKKYDLIYLDVFNSITIPFQLTSIEAVQKISDSLTTDGVVITNMVSSLEGVNSKFFRSEYFTYKEIFPTVYVFQVYRIDPKVRQNLFLVGLKNKTPRVLESRNFEQYNILKTIWNKEIESDLPLLTDDYSPVDYYTFRHISLY